MPQPSSGGWVATPASGGRGPSHLQPDDPYEIQPIFDPNAPAPAPGEDTPPGGLGDTTMDFGEPELASDSRHPASEEDLLERFPYMRWMLGIPELKQLLDTSYTQGWSSEEFEANLWQTEWWRTRSESARQWDEGIDRDPGQAARRRQSRRTYITQQANQLGIQLSEMELSNLIEQSLRWDFTTEEIMASLGGEDRTIGFGSIRETADRIISDAGAMYLDYDYETALGMARRIETGDLSYDAISSHLRDQAKMNYTQFSQAIDDGFTLQEATLGMRQAVANTLEMSANDIDFRDSTYAPLMGMTDDSGNTRIPTIGEARRWARQQEGYAYTGAAAEKATSSVIQMKRLMGTSAVFG